MSTEERNMEEMILQKAEELFVEKGFNAVSTTQIAREVGCNQALVHYYYRTKEKLFSAIFDSKFKVISAALLPSLEDKSLPLIERIEVLVGKHFDMLSEHTNIPQFVLYELSSNKERRAMFIEKFKNISQLLYADLQQELDEEVAKGTIAEIRAIDLMLNIILLNISVFLMLPLAKEFYQHHTGLDNYLVNRKKENVALIIGRLQTHKH